MEPTAAARDGVTLASPLGTFTDPNASAAPVEPAAPSRLLKLAVFVIVALLCIAFAGLVWALIF